MRHRLSGKKLNRNTAHRKALARNLVRSLVAEFDEKGQKFGGRKAVLAQSPFRRLGGRGRAPEVKQNEGERNPSTARVRTCPPEVKNSSNAGAA